MFFYLFQSLVAFLAAFGVLLGIIHVLRAVFVLHAGREIPENAVILAALKDVRIWTNKTRK